MDAVDRIIECGLAAPSSKNAQPWCFHVVTRRSLLTEIASLVRTAKEPTTFVPIDPATEQPRAKYTSTVAESAEVLSQATLGIFIENLGEFSNGRLALSHTKRSILPNALIGYGLEILGIGAAVENMWLAAEALGMRGVFMGDVLIAEPEIRELLAMQGDLIGVLALGIPDMTAPTTARPVKANRVRRHD